ncbi:MAG: hypothetical protein AABY32_03915 [Nanoarchaeota archaeon]
MKTKGYVLIPNIKGTEKKLDKAVCANGISGSPVLLFLNRFAARKYKEEDIGSKGFNTDKFEIVEVDMELEIKDSPVVETKTELPAKRRIIVERADDLKSKLYKKL